MERRVNGKTSELRSTGRRWRKQMAQFGEEVWFRRIGEESVSSFASRMIEGILVSHHRTGSVLLCEARVGQDRH